MQSAQNVVSANGFAIKVSKAQLPFSNNFVQIKDIEQVEPNEVQTYVKCTSNSNEPGRIYFVAYSKATGELVECYTTN
jgi:hypothetical protein